MTARHSPAPALASGAGSGLVAWAAKWRPRALLGTALPLALIALVGLAVHLTAGLDWSARVALFAFAVAAVLWTTTRLNATFVGLAATLLLVLAGGAPQERLFSALAAEVIWLMIGAFVLGEAVQRSGLAARLMGFVVGRAGSVRGVCWLITAALIPLTFLVPSTSGRAAVTLPVFRSLVAAADDPRVTRALALLIPTVILVATVSALIGAASHLIANDLLGQLTGQPISFLQWALYGLPFGVVASAVATWTIVHLFLDRECRDQPLPVAANRPAPWSAAERTVLLVIAVMVALWVTAGWHGLRIATVSLIGALVLMAPGVGVLSWKDGLKAVSWDLVIFVGAALVLGQALIATGVARWLVDGLWDLGSRMGTESSLLVLLMLAAISLTSHLFLTSHTARAAALVPGLLYLASSLELNPTAVMFIGTVGMNYCLTFPISSKALLIFQALDGETYRPTDLLRLSAVMLVAHVVLILLFYYGYWRWIGLAL